MEPPSDDVLWRRAAAGDAGAFGDLYERHCRAVYNYLFRRLGDWSDAEELTAVVFLEAFRRRRDVRVENGKVLPWLYGIATNLVRNRRRSLRRQRNALEGMDRAEPSSDGSADALARVDAEQRMRALLRLVGRLRKDQQDVVALCIWSELSYEEAAVALDVPVGTIRSRLARARAALRELADANGHELGDPDARSVVL
ncbi:MAG: RNA polymerase sigma factor [Thermoleophilia bacterium]|nr:RNA polymerase sigma factor [Thermoleophilia bacterium]